MCCFEVFFFKRYFHLLFLTLWKTTVKNRECIIPRRHVLSAFQHVFQLKAWDSVTSPAAGPSLCDCAGPAARDVVTPLHPQTVPSPKKVLSP